MWSQCICEELFSEFEKRFYIKEQNAIQAKLANFNLLTIKTGEKAIEFADRILSARLELLNVGVKDDMISKTRIVCHV